jgi:hypothetical protein
LQGTLEDSCFQEVMISIASHRTVPPVTPRSGPEQLSVSVGTRSNLLPIGYVKP